ncbi:MAG TPA: response regulator, partial [Miltoncostaeaceae bacterium]|nr:response regulator [Miltoncostaeaceae bacterium]
EGKLGGQANVEDVSGTWRDLTDSVNSMASNLTDQVRAIAAVSTAVTSGDLTRSIGVEAQGEVAELKDTINQMILNLRETTERNADQSWLNSNLARFSGMMQGQRDLGTVSRLIMSELTPLVRAHYGAFFLADSYEDDEAGLHLAASYGYRTRRDVPTGFQPGEGLVGQAALEKKPIVLEDVPSDYIKIGSGLGEAPPGQLVVLPVLFEGRVMGLIELASFKPFSEVHQWFVEQLAETIGIVINAIVANMRTEELLEQSQSLTQELQDQQSELQGTNAELAEKATLLAEQNERIEVKNREIEMARLAIEEKAEQLALSSRYKSEFLANMSHELRTPLNSLLILARLLSENADGNLSDKQIEFSRTIFAAGNDLLDLIDDILDLSKVEAGKMDVHASEVRLPDVVDYVERSFRLLVEEKGLAFHLELDPALPEMVVTDEQRLQQILRNLLSNAVKFTHSGTVSLAIGPVLEGDQAAGGPADGDARIAFAVRDTGIGISHDRLELIFEAFQQADGTTSRRFGGTGLGLSISREIAKLLGGEIRVESHVGRGSTFTLTLPATLPAPSFLPEEPAGADSGTEDRAAAAAMREPADDRDEVGEGDRVLLIVEDDPSFAQVLVSLGREAGFKCIAAARGDTGLALAHEHHPDAIMLDLALPVIDGITVLAHLKRHPVTKNIPVHVLSGAAEPTAALAAGATSVMRKPIESDRLLEVLGSLTRTVGDGPRRLLVVGGDGERARATLGLPGDEVELLTAEGAEAAADVLAGEGADCVLVHLDGPARTELSRLGELRPARGAPVPVIVLAERDLDDGERAVLAEHEAMVLVVDTRSPEALVAEAAAFLGSLTGARPERRPAARIDPAAFYGKRVLIVDDDVRNVFALAAALEARGMDVAYAENGAEGIDVLRGQGTVDVMLLDVMMPEMDGYETMRAIRAMPEFAGLPIIAVTAKAMQGDRERAIASGASDYITKPVDTDQLLALMGIWLYDREPEAGAALGG